MAGNETAQSRSVYDITCQNWYEECIGDTVRLLYVRVKEQYDGRRGKSRMSTKIGNHRVREHTSEELTWGQVNLLEVKPQNVQEGIWINAIDHEINPDE